MTSDHRAKLEQAAREWLRTKYNPTNDPIEHIEVLANLLASQRAAVLEEVIRQVVMYSDHDDLIEWLRQQVQERRA